MPSTRCATIRAGMPSGELLIGGAAAIAVVATRVRGRRARGDEVDELREELRHELQRLAGADIEASRGRRERASPPG